jgi:P27 family predicted phage terminase small subunit
MPECPAWLDDDARAKWFATVSELQALDMLAKIDGDALARYCDTWVWWQRTREFLKENGDTYTAKNEDGTIRYMQQYPQVAIAHKLAAELTRLQACFGMTPSSRSEVKPAKKAVDKSPTRFFKDNA